MNPYYSDELVTLYHGDCREITEWLTADVLVTDPPYGVAWAQNSMHYTRTIKPTENVVQGDASPKIRDAALALWGSRPAVVFGSWRVARPPATKQRLIWHKTRLNPGMSNAPWFSADEEIYVIGSGFVGKPHQTVYPTTEARGGADGLSAQVGHPTPKPVGLMEQLILKCPPGAVADPFAGSGSTLIAAKHVGRKCIGVELEERYCEIAARRLDQGVLDFGEVTA
jgi:site-specific DNA-methyltransferase (adenine-specific)